jgi:hypothetical protein
MTRVNETLGKTVELKIISHAADFFNQILSFLTCGGSCIVKTLNQPLFTCGGWLYLKLRCRSMGEFPVDFGGQCRLFPDDQNIKKAIALSDSIAIVNWKEGLKLLRRLEEFCDRYGP